MGASGCRFVGVVALICVIAQKETSFDGRPVVKRWFRKGFCPRRIVSVVALGFLLQIWKRICVGCFACLLPASSTSRVEWLHMCISASFICQPVSRMLVLQRAVLLRFASLELDCNALGVFLSRNCLDIVCSNAPLSAMWHLECFPVKVLVFACRWQPNCIGMGHGRKFLSWWRWNLLPC